MKLFQYAIFWLPTEQQIKDGKKPLILKDVTSVLAKDEQGANILAAREIPDDYVDQLEQITIVVNAF